MASSRTPSFSASAPQSPNVNHSSAFDRAAQGSSPVPPVSGTETGHLSRSASHASHASRVSHHSQHYPHQEGAPDGDPTLLNTIANARGSSPAPHADPSFAAPVPLSQRPTKFTEEWDASQRGGSVVDGHSASNMQRSNSFSGSASGDRESIHLPARSNTLKKKGSLRRSGSLKRSGSRRSMKAGSVRSLALQSTAEPDEQTSAFYCPVPTTGHPTEVLSNRFQAWRKILKDLITYFREVQTHYEHRAKSLLKLANVLNNINTPAGFLTSGGLDDAIQVLRGYNKQSILEANKAREIEEDVILALTGLRSDLQQKIKEIKNLSGDFKNAVDKEMDVTRKVVKTLQDVLGQSDLDSSLTTGKQDPYLLRLAVDRQLDRQLEEENYLHQAYLNLENSGRELESIVVGEIQKSYKAYASILHRESEAATNTIDELRGGPIAMPREHEWMAFVQKDDQFVDPNVPIRQSQFIHYPGRDHYACQEIRAGLLERKSKYLKSYTAGWYVLSPTHLHEFKSADKTQAPVMSLYLPEQKLGSHSSGGGSSNKFILKGRQTGSMHRGHTWVFRAESHDTMMAWYEDIKALTEKTPQERSEFVRGHSRSFSQSSQHSISSDGVVEEEDEEPFDADSEAARQTPREDVLPRRPSPGGRFPSDLQVNAQRGLQAPLSPSSIGSEAGGDQDRQMAAAATALPGHAADNQYGQNQAEPASYQSQPDRGYSAPLRQGSELGGQNTYAAKDYANDADTYGSGPGVTSAYSQDWNHQGYGYPSAGSAYEHGGYQPPVGQHSGQDQGAYFGYAGGMNRMSHPPGPVASSQPDPMYASAAPQSASQQIAHEPTVMRGMVYAPSAGIAPAQVDQAPIQSLPIRSVPVNGSAGGMKSNFRNDSVPTISHLHIPGEYPKTTPTTEYPRATPNMI